MADVSKDARDKALKSAIDQIEKQHGKGSIMRLNDSAVVPVEAISTSSLSLDAAIGIGRQFGDTRVSLEAAAQRTDGFSATNAGAPAYFDPDDDASRTRSLGLSAAHTLAPGHALALRRRSRHGRRAW